MADEAEAEFQTRDTRPNMTEVCLFQSEGDVKRPLTNTQEKMKPSYNYDGKTKSYYGQGGDIELVSISRNTLRAPY